MKVYFIKMNKVLYESSGVLLLALLCLLFPYAGFAQDNDTLPERQKKIEISGFVNDMPSVIMPHPDSTTLWQNLIHNRLNAGWQINKNIRVDASMRNRLMVGNMVGQPGYAKDIGFDKGRVDMSWNVIDEKNVLLNTSFDRMFVTYEKDKWNLQLGRQRINWGQTLVWNPNDIFNTYSYFDFDYVERPGCDAFRGTYYHNETSSTELAASINYDNKISAAMLHRWNRKNFDYQVIGGILTQSDIVIGGAWSGDFKGVNFRGEASYFHPVKSFTDTSGIAAVSIGFDYMFKNSLMLQTEVLYNNVGNTFARGGLLALYTAPLSAKYLSICDWNIFVQSSYPFTPRLTASLSGMYFVNVKSCYAGLSVDYSLVENLDLSFVTQYFSTIGKSDLGDLHTWLGFMRLKYSF